MKVKLSIEVEISEDVYGFSEEEKQWLIDDILIAKGQLILHSNEIGDTVGVVTAVSGVEFHEEKNDPTTP